MLRFASLIQDSTVKQEDSAPIELVDKTSKNSGMRGALLALAICPVPPGRIEAGRWPIGKFLGQQALTAGRPRSVRARVSARGAGGGTAGKCRNSAWRPAEVRGGRVAAQ